MAAVKRSSLPQAIVSDLGSEVHEPKRVWEPLCTLIVPSPAFQLSVAIAPSPGSLRVHSVTHCDCGPLEISFENLSLFPLLTIHHFCSNFFFCFAPAPMLSQHSLPLLMAHVLNMISMVTNYTFFCACTAGR